MTQYAPGGDPASAEYPSSATAYGQPDEGASSSAQSAKERAADAAQTSKQAGAEVASNAAQAGSEVAQSAAERAKDVAGETKRQARDLLGEAKQQLQSQAGAQHSSLVSNLRQLGEELGSMAGSSSQSGVATELVSQAHERVNSVADWLESRQPGDLLTEARRYAQQHPGTFLVGAALAGVLAGRLTRGVVAAHRDDGSSSQGYPATTGYSESYTEIQGGYSSGYTPTTTYGETSGYGTGTGAGTVAGDPYAAQHYGGAYPGSDPYQGGQYGGTGYPGTPADPGYTVPPSGGTTP
jgi:ElaB/YqjD/DUF883 family membrane-anchored ribosome-binding protein